MNLMKIPKKHMHIYLLAMVMIIFVAMPVDIPTPVASMVDTIVGKMVVVLVVVNLFMTHPVIGAVGAVAGYELIRRSGGMAIKDIMKKFIPSELKKSGNMSSFNQFPVTVEEMVIKSKVPYSFNLSVGSESKSSFKPVVGDIHDATTL